MATVFYQKMAYNSDAFPPETLKNATFTAAEKVHGSNFSVRYDFRAVRFAKRTSLLEPGQPFFGYELHFTARRQAQYVALCEEVAARVSQLCVECPLGREGACDHAKPAQRTVAEVAVFGELCGGAYPEESVPKAPGAVPIQVGVYYAPSVEFFPFDVSVTWSDGSAHFLPFALVRELCAAHAIKCVPLAPGASLGMALQACVALPVAFPSQVPALLGLPPLAKNTAEGMVVRVDNKFEPAAGARCLLKRKTAEFAESHALPALKKASPEVELLLSNCTAARCAAAASKTGDHFSRPEDWPRIVEAALKDAMDDAGLDPADDTLVERLASELAAARARLTHGLVQLRAEMLRVTGGNASAELAEMISDDGTLAATVVCELAEKNGKTIDAQAVARKLKGKSAGIVAQALAQAVAKKS